MVTIRMDVVFYRLVVSPAFPVILCKKCFAFSVHQFHPTIKKGKSGADSRNQGADNQLPDCLRPQVDNHEDPLWWTNYSQQDSRIEDISSLATNLWGSF
jgi:hypothetical protein